MEQNAFYKHVSSWIRSYRTVCKMDNLTQFVKDSNQPNEIKQRLYKEIDQKIRVLNEKPSFVLQEGINYLANEDSYPHVYTSRFTAICKIAELTLKGMPVELCCTGLTYRIKLLETVKESCHS